MWLSYLFMLYSFFVILGYLGFLDASGKKGGTGHTEELQGNVLEWQRKNLVVILQGVMDRSCVNSIGASWREILGAGFWKGSACVCSKV